MSSGNNEEKLSWLDKHSQGLVTALEDHLPRRHILRRLGGMMLGALGVAVIAPELYIPERRTVHAAATGCNCDVWWLCGLYGRVCCYLSSGTCLFNAGDCGDCPSGDPVSSSSWSYCCKDGNGVNHLISYGDCCSDGTYDCESCPWCEKNPNAQPSWCSPAAYDCTYVSDHGPNTC